MADAETGGGAAYFLYAPVDVILEIVRRLPPVSVIRLRAVCKAWRDVTSSMPFVAALYDLQPSQPLICFNLEACPDSYVDLRDYCVEAVDLRSDELRSIIRFTDNTYEVATIDDVAAYYDDEEVKHAEWSLLMVHASLDGLLLVSFINNWYVCNPATRQWATLPELEYRDVVGLYHHVSSGEYRVLYHKGQDNVGAPTCYYVLTVGSQLARSIGRPISLAATEDWGLAALAIGLDYSFRSPPIQLHGKLHWPLMEFQNMKVTIFDTEAEVFSWMMSSPVSLRNRSATKGYLGVTLLEMKGKLGMSISWINGEELELWGLEDHQSLDWVMLYLIRLPVLQMTSLHHEDWFPSIVSPEGDVMIVCRDRLIHCNWHGEELHSLLFPDKKRMMSIFVRHQLKERLLPHEMFLAPKGDDVVEPPFFRGL